MKKMILGLILLAVLVLGLPRARAGKPCTVPKDWGTVKAMAVDTGYNLLVAFEAADGTVRIVNAECGSPAKANYLIPRE